MRTTITLDDDVFEIARAQAEASGERLREVLSLLVRRGLRTGVETQARSGLPVFQVPPGTKIIPANRAYDLMANEA